MFIYINKYISSFIPLNLFFSLMGFAMKIMFFISQKFRHSQKKKKKKEFRHSENPCYLVRKSFLILFRKAYVITRLNRRFHPGVPLAVSKAFLNFNFCKDHSERSASRTGPGPKRSKYPSNN